MFFIWKCASPAWVPLHYTADMAIFVMTPRVRRFGPAAAVVI
jgi:hypothetical protein